MKFHIEAARPDDFLNIAALDRIAWPELPDTYIPDGEHIWRVWCDYGTLLVARISERGPLSESQDIAGALIHFPTRTGEVFLHKLFVHPICRNLGIGSALMKAALTSATAPVLLTVDPQNVPAIKLYENMGFRVRERVPGYYRPHEDRCIMVFSPTNPQTA